MVGGRRVLLSIAALALDTALGGPLRFRDDVASGNNSPVSAGIPETPTSSISTQPTTRLPPAPPTRAQAQVTVTQAPETFWFATTTAKSKTNEEDDDPYLYPPKVATDELYTNEEAPTRPVDASASTRAPPAATATTTEVPDLVTGPSRTKAPPPSGEASGPLTVATAVTTLPPKRPPTMPTISPVTWSTAETFDLGTTLSQRSTSAPTNVYYPPLETGMPTPENPTDPDVTGGGSKVVTATPCQPSDDYMPKTIYEIVYTSTLTWYGQPADYTPLYPPIELPGPSCVTVPVEPTPTVSPMAHYTVISTTWCTSTGVGTRFRTCIPTVTTSFFYSTNQPTETPPEPEMMAPAGLARPMPSPSPVIILTTDKNPVVIFTSQKPPNYGVTTGPVTREQHAPVTGNNVPPITTPVYDSGPSTPLQQQQPSDPVTVAVRPTAVVINGNTFTDASTATTQTVVVSGVSFTIDPTRVVGGGATITRTPTAPPTSTVLGGLQVLVSSSVAVVGGSTFSIESTPRTAVVSGQTVRIDSTAVVVGGQTLAVPTVPRPTEVVVAGGDLITAIGQSILVVKSTTITYGLTGTSTTVVDNDTITFGPGGVTVHGTTLGGTAAKAGVTDFAVVGGATITRIGTDVVVIGNSTFTVGPGMPTATITFGGETITLSPRGVSVSTLDLPWPFGPTYTITPGATMTPNAAPTGGGEAEKDGAAGLRPDVPAAVTLICLTMGILFLGI
ncbi:hypothetical protein QBC39DRAFT_326526 [Podospora conica]|nr:hypothetical protein QBC39DRAFT_326526 [Schizothecium conicum]